MTPTKQFDAGDRDMLGRHARREAPVAFLRKPVWWLAALALLAGIAVAVYYYGREPSREAIESRPAPASETVPVPKAAEEPTLRHPIAETQPQFRQGEPLPAL